MMTMAAGHKHPPGLITVPVLHGRMEFAVAVRQAMESVRPACLAVELPETLREPVLRAVKRLPLLSVVQYLDKHGRPVYLPIEPADPLVEALRSGLEQKIPVALVDQDVDSYHQHDEAWPDSYAVKRLGYARYVSACESTLANLTKDPQDESRERVMAFHLRHLLEKHERVLFVCGLAHAAAVSKLIGQPETGEPLRRRHREEVTLYHLSSASSREVMAETPYLSAAYEQARLAGAAGLDGLDRLEESIHLAQKARPLHEKNSGEQVVASALQTMFRFARNYALVEGRLAPDLYQLLVAARGAINDNYAYELWELATTWPHQSAQPELPVLDLSIEDLYEHARYMRFHRTQKTRRQRMLRVIKKRPTEEKPGQWRELWDGDAICSYPPEDIVVEGYGAFLKKKAKGILSSDNVRVEPFSASLLDGIDVRETLRNWHEGRLYVRELQIAKGDVGAVVVIFDEDKGQLEKYSWKLTWQGEHSQESDMAFYATAAGEKLVGPGISRCEYGGFLLSYPPGRMFHVFEDPFFDRAESKPERLLLAAIDYSKEKSVVYVGPNPPRSMMRVIAERYGKKIVYIPLGDLSPLSLRQLRVVHILDGYPVRHYAKDFIW